MQSSSIYAVVTVWI